MRSGPAFTLLELLVATTLLVVAISMVSLNMRGVSEKSLAQSARLQLRTLYRLAQVQAARSGRPCLLACNSGGCRLRTPLFGSDGWRWRDGPGVELPAGVRLRGVNGDAQDSDDDAHWDIPVSAGCRALPVTCTLGLRSGRTAVVRIDSALVSR